MAPGENWLFSPRCMARLPGPGPSAPASIKTPPTPMYNALTHLNYLAVLGTAVAGFMIGWF